MNAIDALQQGARMVLSPGLRRYVVVPVAISAVLYVVLLGFLYAYLPGWSDALTRHFPSWLHWLSWLIWLLVTATSLVITYFTFTLVVAFLASPFYGLLAEQVERQLGGSGSQDERRWGQLITDSLGREWQKLSFILPRMALLFAIGFVPGTQPFMPVAWLLLSAWCLSIQYLDYVMDNHQVSFADMRGLLWKHKGQTLLFGLILMPLIVVPILNLIIMPAAVAAGVILWQHHYRTAS
ncbi:sulfate transporter CysZ [Zymobacter sp. IVIA_5232.4 C2]|uniref:sulfate transporter CysZ n=1 Tax=Zymobacter sp. IVIA_5232.4 C2 TaxID=3394855 RepID=UPI0039C4A27C